MEYEEQKKVSLLLGLGIFFFPIIFAWFTLKKGYSTLAKAVSFAWLGLTLIAAFAMPNPEAETAPVAQPQPAQVESESVETSNDSVVADEAVEENTPTLTLQQKNAIRSAENYLSFQGFSRDGLIHQLSSDAGDGYPIGDATMAVDSLNVDWNEQAARSAKHYLSFTSFSCKGLVEQLSSDAGEKFTESQARYGAKKTGICQ